MAESGVHVYADALFEIVSDPQVIREEFQTILSLLNENAVVQEFLHSPKPAKNDKKKFFTDVFSGKISTELFDFMQLVIDRDRIDSLNDIYAFFNILVDKKLNRLNVKIITPIALDEKSILKIKDSLKIKFNKDILLDNVVDANIIGGMILKVGDTVFDGSFIKDLKLLKSQMLNRKIRGEVAYEN